MKQDVEHLKNELTECVTMILMNKKGLKLIYILFGAVFAAGCTMQTTPSLLTATSNAGDVTTKILTDVPFAYDTVVDTISYNSCVGSGLNSSGLIHGLKLGANEGFVDSTGTGAIKAGVKLKSDFLQYLAKNLNPVYPNTTIVPAQIQYILENSDKNKELMIQYAVRLKTDLSVVRDVIDPSVASNIILNRDGIYESSILSSNPVLAGITKSVQFGPNRTVAAEGPRVNNLGSASAPDTIEGSLGFSAAYDESYQPTANVDDGVGAGEEYSDRTREKFNLGQYILALTYGNTSSVSSSDTTGSFGLNSPRRAESSILNKAYGRGFELGFTTKNASVPSQRRNILSRVVEKDLSTGALAAGASWTCENYVIMKTNQWNNKKTSEPACSEIFAKDLAAATTGPALRARIARLRRHYSEANWGIGFLVRENTVYDPNTRASLPLCLVNKAVDCYLPTTGLIASAPDADVGVNYNAAMDGNLSTNSECYLSRYSQMGVTYIGNKSGDAARALGRCPQFASICVRTSTSF